MTLLLTDLVEPIKRAVAVPGTFDSVFPDTGDSDLLGSLLDGFAEAQLDGFFATITVDDTGLSDTDLTRPMSALIVIYTATRVLQNQLRNLKSHVKYAAGSASFETDQAASVLVELLKEMSNRKAELLERSINAGAGATFLMADAYMTRLAPNTGFVDWNYPLLWPELLSGSGTAGFGP